MVCAGSSGVIKIYKEIAGIFTFQEDFSVGYAALDVQVSEDLSQIAVLGNGLGPEIYKKVNGLYTLQPSPIASDPSSMILSMRDKIGIVTVPII